MMHLLRRGLHTLPLLAALWLLGWLPQITESGLSGSWPLPWRLDALTFWFILNLTLGVALLPLGWRDTLRALAALLLLIALCAEHLLLLPIALIALAALLWSWRWLLAGAFLTLGVGLLWWAGGTTWSAATTATAITPLAFLLILVACGTGLNCYPLVALPQPFDPLRQALQPVWLLPLIRTIEWGPWNSGWSLAVVVLGGATALWSSANAIWTNDRGQRIEQILGTWLGLALASVGLLSTVGIASALWQVLAYTLGIGVLLRAERGMLWAGPVPPTVGFVAAWLAQGATAAGGAFLLAAVCWLATLLSGIAVLRLRAETTAPTHAAALIAVGLTLALGVFAPLPLRWLILPAIEPLQGGLTPFGLLDIWPWVGMAALDAGHRRVAVLPSIAVAVLALVAAALVWLLARLLGWVDLPSDNEQAHGWSTTAWQQLRQQVWWIKGRNERG
jgi:hypothetical protein